ncbi:MAG: peroxidase-related enzyme [Acetobacteraceae bacterium]|nr:peroxidase-related enzyme [Acetobacteraceae bacterium]MDW8397564.1 peroxidase-related enzyme [Acetobacteraceae bacterium]
MSVFTLKPVGWRPRLPPVKPETASPDQLAALEACPPAQRRSAYFLTLANDPASLGERGALFTAVMYAEGGLDRAERELATTVVSMVNGCAFCTSVHARRFVELTGEEAAMRRILEAGWRDEPDPRRAAICRFAERLTRQPAAVTAADLAPLRAAGLTDLELLDLIHCVAMFANANRLMLSLGDALPP